MLILKIWIFYRNHRDKPVCLSLIQVLFIFYADGTPSTSAVCFPLVDTDASGNGHSIFVTVIYGGLTIVVMYKSPMFQKSRFRQMLHSSLSLVNTNVIYVGDINLDMCDEKNSDIVEVFAKYGLQSRLNLKETSTNGNTHINVCFSDIDFLNCRFYVSYYSYHKPICVAWPKY